MRVLVIDPYYEPFLQQHYRENRRLAHQSYNDQLASLLRSCFGTADVYSRNFRRLGHAARELIPNCVPLQHAWARENGAPSVFAGLLSVSGRMRSFNRITLQRILEAQVRAFDPDVLYFQSVTASTRGGLDRFHREGRLLVGQIACAPPPASTLRRFDLLITSLPNLHEWIRSLGVPVKYVPLAVDREVLNRLRAMDVSTDVSSHRPRQLSFVGSLDAQTYRRATPILEAVAEQLPLEVWGYAESTLPEHSPLRRRYRGPAWGLDMYRLLAESGMTVNRHNDIANGLSNNMRLYEATGVGTLVFTEASPNLGDLFEPDREVVTYTNADDLVDKINHYLRHEAEREAIAAAGQRRTLQDHTYEGRLERVTDHILARL
jgi:spore maturation protein CgeB